MLLFLLSLAHAKTQIHGPNGKWVINGRWKDTSKSYSFLPVMLLRKWEHYKYLHYQGKSEKRWDKVTMNSCCFYQLKLVSMIFFFSFLSSILIKWPLWLYVTWVWTILWPALAIYFSPCFCTSFCCFIEFLHLWNIPVTLLKLFLFCNNYFTFGDCWIPPTPLHQVHELEVKCFWTWENYWKRWLHE